MCGLHGLCLCLPFRLASLPPVLREDHGGLITAMVDWLATPCMQFVRRSVKELVTTSDGNLSMSLMYLFEMLMHEAVQDEKEARNNKNLKSWIVVGHAHSSGSSHTLL